MLFYEYFHGDNGAGLGASHQTGWTGLVARVIQMRRLPRRRTASSSTPSAGCSSTKDPTRDGSAWPAEPVVYELNTAAWLHDVGRSRRRPRRRWPTVPDAEWDARDAGRRRRGVADGGVAAQPGRRASWPSTPPSRWRRSTPRCPTSPTPTSSARPTASARYEVDDRFGGRAGLAAARAALAGAGRAAARRLRAEPRRPRPPVARRAPGLLRPGHAPTTWPRDPAAFLAGRRRRSSPAAATRTSRRGPTSPSSTRSPRRCVGAAIDTLDRHRRAGRRRALRHGDADAQRRVPPHLGRPGRRAAGDGVLDRRDRRGARRRTPASCSSPRPTGTWSGTSSSSASTTATTSGSTTGCCTRAPARCAGTCTPTSTTSAACSGSSRTTTSRGPRPSWSSAPEQSPPRWLIATLPGRDAVARGPVRRLAGAPAGVPRPPPGGAVGRRPARVLPAPRSPRRREVRRRATGRCARPPAGPATPRASSSSRGAGPSDGERSLVVVNLSGDARRTPGSTCRGTTSRGRVVAARRPARRATSFERDGDELAERGPVRRPRPVGLPRPALDVTSVGTFGTWPASPSTD